MKPILIFLGIFLIFLGFFLITLGMIIPDKNVEKNENIEYSGIIFIGPIPIVFGNSPYLIIISLLIFLLMIVWILLAFKIGNIK
ncbi:TIGR00304 family membrane protein [Methanocaldococcus indicus]|uniref:TIGR00304 family membrane protein n=1 Tax=Methanocaldococcus indicus TaxID=213231 RepID=UPI003C6D1C05